MSPPFFFIEIKTIHYSFVRVRNFSKLGWEWLACSPDAVALIDLDKIGLSSYHEESSTASIASVEIKTSVV